MAPTSTNFPVGDVVLDASVILNLLGCEAAREALTALDVTCLIEQRTLAEIKRHPVPGFSHTHVLSELIDEGRICVERMTSTEYAAYLDLVAGEPSDVLGDGESAAIALAAGRGLAVILDDRKARRICSGKFPAVPYASSLRLFLEAGARGGWNDSQVRQVVQAALSNARMAILRDEQTLLLGLGLQL